MAYSSFTLNQIEKLFNLQFIENKNLFIDVLPENISPRLADILDYNTPLALANNTEKARSEMIIAPILIELNRCFSDKISLFSGVEFNIDDQKGLTGFCDFIISHTIEQLYVKSPVIMLVEAKNENIKNGIAQCIAEMVAAQIFNQKNNENIEVIYGLVTTGTSWKFLRLIANKVDIDRQEYYISEPNKIWAILKHMVLNMTNS